MSDDKEKDPKPMKKTSAVPLRKETVRVTLKADSDSSSKSAPKPPAPPSPPKAPSAPKPPAPAPTIPLKSSGPSTAKPPAPAPTVQLQTGAATNPPAPAPTVKLNTPSTTSPATVSLTGGSSQPLPKATVQLQQTQPMGAPATPSQAATIRTADDDDGDADRGEGAATVLSVVALLAALLVLGVQLATASIWVEGEWGKLFE